METTVQTVGEPSGFVQLLETLWLIAKPTLLLIASWAGLKLASWFSARTKIQIPKEKLALLDEWALRGIHYAEEQSRAWAKKHSSPPDSATKLQTAVAFVMAFVEKQGWDEWTAERVAKYVEAKLNIERAAPALVSASATVATPSGVGA